MAKIPRSYNYYISESAENTFTGSSFELPLSSGAKSVIITSVILEVDKPSKVASTNCVTEAALRLGKATETAVPEWNTTGVIARCDEQLECDATPLPVWWSENAPFVRDNIFEVVPRDTDGKFYITASVKGTSNSGARSARWRVCYLVIT